jgi:hypothetical protein
VWRATRRIAFLDCSPQRKPLPRLRVSRTNARRFEANLDFAKSIVIPVKLDEWDILRFGGAAGTMMQPWR